MKLSTVFSSHLYYLMDVELIYISMVEDALLSFLQILDDRNFRYLLLGNDIDLDQK